MCGIVLFFFSHTPLHPYSLQFPVHIKQKNIIARKKNTIVELRAYWFKLIRMLCENHNSLQIPVEITNTSQFPAIPEDQKSLQFPIEITIT
jgi:hypothetical protein